MTRGKRRLRPGDLQLRILEILWRSGESTVKETRRGLVDDLVERLFRGSVEDVVHHLLESREVGPDELEKIAALIARRRRKRR